MTDRENRLRAYRFESPEHTPTRVGFWGSCFLEEVYDQDRLWEIIEAFPRVTDGRRRPPGGRRTFVPWATVGQRYTDPFGCVWVTHQDGATGQVVEHPLDDWSKLAAWTPPSPQTSNGKKFVDWPEELAALARRKQAGELVTAALDHGHTFLRMVDLVGYEKLLYSMADGAREVGALADLLADYNAAIVQKLLSVEPDIVGYPEDLGMQIGPMLSPDDFRTWIVPVYRRLMAPAKDTGCVVHMHSDGDLRTLLPDICRCGVDVINCQEECNTLGWLKAEIRGSIAIDLGLSARVIATAEPGELRDYILRCAEELGSPAGGLSLGCQLPPGVPWENIETLLATLDAVSKPR